jgi:predicted peptidase
MTIMCAASFAEIGDEHRCSATPQGGEMTQQACVFEAEIRKPVRLRYLLHLPDGYAAHPRKKWPLILFLHGTGERGDDLKLVRKHGIPKIVENRADFPFICASPQCPDISHWTMETDALNALLDDLLAAYRVDRHRVYLTGLSMGGDGTWRLAWEHPERFAAIAPICGGLWSGITPGKAARVLKEVPAWAFHGARDQAVPLAESKRIVKALETQGTEVRLTVYPEAGHDSWTETYSNPKLYKWLLAHRKMQGMGK